MPLHISLCFVVITFFFSFVHLSTNISSHLISPWSVSGVAAGTDFLKDSGLPMTPHGEVIVDKVRCHTPDPPPHPTTPPLHSTLQEQSYPLSQNVQLEMSISFALMVLQFRNQYCVAHALYMCCCLTKCDDLLEPLVVCFRCITNFLSHSI